MSVTNPIQHYKDIKKLNGMIHEYEQKLDDQVNNVFTHIIGQTHNINDYTLPQIENKKTEESKSFVASNRRKTRTFSTGGQSCSAYNYHEANQDLSLVESLLKSSKFATIKQEAEKEVLNERTRAIGGKKYAKPHFSRKKPDIMTKQMRWDPFYEKNMIRAQELEKGMLSLIERGKIGRNIDIITAFEKGKPVFEAHQAIFHHAEEKYAEADMQQIVSRASTKKKLSNLRNPEANQHPRPLIMSNESEQKGTNWALTIPEESDKKYQQNHSKSNEIQEAYYLQFLHYKLIKDSSFKAIKQNPKYYQQWGQLQNIFKSIQKTLRKYKNQLIYINSNKILELSLKYQCLNKIKQKQIVECIAQPKKQFSLSSIADNLTKKQLSIAVITSALKMNHIRLKYISVLHRKKVEKKIKSWIKNGKIIKDYRKQLQQYREELMFRFEKQQKDFKVNYPSIQSSKHYEIHISNQQYMHNFKYFEDICNTEVTRIFNLENVNTNIIYVFPFELNVDMINYYFKIMELEEIQSYHDRVTFLELQDVSSNNVRLPSSLTSSAKLYYCSKALRKLKRKIKEESAYFVISYPTATDIALSVYLGIPILSGNFQKINPLRSILNSDRLLTDTIEPMPAFRIQPKSINAFQLSNMLIRYCESNKKCRKYVLKINNRSSSSGLALLQYPFNSLPEMYNNTTLVQPYYFKSLQKYYAEFTREGGIVQKYEEGIRTVTVCGRILHDEQFVITGTFERISTGFVNVAYIFPQQCVPHKVLMEKTRGVFKNLIRQQHMGYVELTLVVDHLGNVYLEQIQLFSTKITSSLCYFKFLAGGYFNHLGEFMTKIAMDAEENQQQQIVAMESRGYCYVPFLLHFGLSEKQNSSFFQLCRIAGISFDLQNKYGTTFILLGSLKNTIGLMTTAKDRKTAIKLLLKSEEFLIKQNSHNISSEMLKQKEARMKERFNILSIKDRMEEL